MRDVERALRVMDENARRLNGAMEELGLKDGDLGEKKAGMLPYLALLAGLAVVLWSNWFFQLPA